MEVAEGGAGFAANEDLTVKKIDEGKPGKGWCQRKDARGEYSAPKVLADLTA